MKNVKLIELESYLKQINAHYGSDLELNQAYGGYRIVDRGGSRDLSNRGSKSETMLFLQGIACAMHRLSPGCV